MKLKRPTAFRPAAVGSLAILLFLSGCQTPHTPIAHAHGYPNTPPATMLIACVTLLQDLGFNITESDSASGLVVGTKDRTAEKKQSAASAALDAAGHVALFVAFTMATRTVAVPGSGDATDRQVIRATFVVKPGKGAATPGSVVTLTLERVMYARREVVRSETVDDPLLAQRIFAALSKSVFLEKESP